MSSLVILLCNEHFQSFCFSFVCWVCFAQFFPILFPKYDIEYRLECCAHVGALGWYTIHSCLSNLWSIISSKTIVCFFFDRNFRLLQHGIKYILFRRKISIESTTNHMVKWWYVQPQLKIIIAFHLFKAASGLWMRLRITDYSYKRMLDEPDSENIAKFISMFSFPLSLSLAFSNTFFFPYSVLYIINAKRWHECDSHHAKTITRNLFLLSFQFR